MGITAGRPTGSAVANRATRWALMNSMTRSSIWIAMSCDSNPTAFTLRWWFTEIRRSKVRIGIALPQLGAIAGPEAITSVARRAEELGFNSIWVLDRLLYPVNPRA